MGKLEKVIVENGITYVLSDDDIYYPDLQLPEGTNYNIGKFGHMRCEYLKKFRHGYYMEMLLEGKLNEYLHDIDEECHEMLDRIVGKYLAKHKPESAHSFMEMWKLREQAKQLAEEVIYGEIVYKYH